MTEGGIADLTQMQRTVAIGNGGSGKSRLARQMGSCWVFRLLILITSPAYGKRRDEATARGLVTDAASQPAWVIEGVYGDALPTATALIWLDLCWRECRAGLTARGLRRGMTEIDHGALLAWASEYWTRQNANSFHGHLRLFESFGGPKLRLRNRSEMDQFVVGLASH